MTSEILYWLIVGGSLIGFAACCIRIGYIVARMGPR